MDTQPDPVPRPRRFSRTRVNPSASEALVRIQHLPMYKRVTLVLCGFTMESPINFTFYSAELFDGQNVKWFLDINRSVEWTENIYLNAWFESVKEAEPEAKAIILVSSWICCCSVQY